MQKGKRVLASDVPGMKTFEEIIDFLKIKLHLETDQKIASLLGFSNGGADIILRRRNNNVPVFRLLTVCTKKDISADELFFGKRPQDFMSRQFKREDIAKRLIGALARVEKEKPDYYRRVYKDVIGEVDWINTKEKTEMSQRLVLDRSVLLQYNRKKIAETVLFFSANPKCCEIFKVCKLMYFLDFLHFRHTGRSVTGLVYFAWKQGPVPVVLYQELIGNCKPDLVDAVEVSKTGDSVFLIPLRSFDNSVFSRREIRLMNELAEHFKEIKCESITEKYYLPKEPWFKTFTEKGKGEMIGYMIAVDGKHGLTRREILERQEEMRDMYRNFGISWSSTPSESGDLYNALAD